MTIGEIKKSALKMMFTNQDNEIDSLDMESLYADSNYGDYLNNMYDCINRAIIRLKSKGVEYTGRRITKDTSDDTELELEWELCEAIAYFIKGELYEEDKVQEAIMAKNYFEDFVDDWLSTKVNTTVDVVFEMDV